MTHAKQPNLKGDRNQCCGCMELFNSTYAFEKHRTGDFELKGNPSNRRCLSVEEMLLKGMCKSNKGYWITEAYTKYDEEAAEDIDEGIEN